MKKVGIVTLYGNSNFGNKLQQYAVQTIIEKYGFDVKNIITKNSKSFEINNRFFIKIINSIKSIKHYLLYKSRYRNVNFYKFEKEYLKNDIKIYYSNEDNLDLDKKYDYFLIGSDQVWNPYFGLPKEFRFLNTIAKSKKISISASIGVSKIPSEEKEYYKKSLMNIKSISVREDEAKRIIENISHRRDIEVLVDPTMLLTSKEWDRVLNRPKQIDKIINKKYILNYFLGELSEPIKKEIEKIAKENNCEIINILDKKDQFYSCGPSEFLYLEKNAFLICTDSFHSSVFAIIYNRPFVVFDRHQRNVEEMNSRIDTIINKFKLENRKYNGKKITKENLKHDYTEAYIILEKERKKAETFLKKALEIK